MLDLISVNFDVEKISKKLRGKRRRNRYPFKKKISIELFERFLTDWKDTEYINLHIRHSRFRFLPAVDLKTHSSGREALIISYFVLAKKCVIGEEWLLFTGSRTEHIRGRIACEGITRVRTVGGPKYTYNLLSSFFFAPFSSRLVSLFAPR